MRALRYAAVFLIASLMLYLPRPAYAVIKVNICPDGSTSAGWLSSAQPGAVTAGCYNSYAFWDEGSGGSQDGSGRTDDSGNIGPHGAGSVHTSRNTASAAKKANDPNPCPASTGDPVRLSSGAKVDTIIDFAEPGEMGLTFERYYNSHYMCGNSATCVSAGAWTTNLDYYLDTSCPPPDPSDPKAPCPPAQFHRPDGSGLTFHVPVGFRGTPGATASTGTGTLTNNGDNTYTLRDEDARALTFDEQGTLLAIKDSLGIGWILTRPDANTIVVTHTNGQSFKLVVSNSNAAYGASKQIQVTDPAGNVYTYQSTALSYDGYANPVSHLGALTAVTLPGSPSTVITYKYLPDNTTTSSMLS